MNYQTMWEELRTELEFLSHERVSVIDPSVVITYMGFIEERQYYREQLESKEEK